VEKKVHQFIYSLFSDKSFSYMHNALATALSPYSYKERQREREIRASALSQSISRPGDVIAGTSISEPTTDKRQKQNNLLFAFLASHPPGGAGCWRKTWRQ
jgi:hypothetical protein